MFDHYKASKQRSWSWGKLALGLAVVVASLIVVLVVLAGDERRDRAAMNAVFAMPLPPPPAARPERATLPGMTLEVPDQPSPVTGDDETGSVRGPEWEVTWIAGERLASEQESASFVAYIANKTGRTVGARHPITIDGRAGYSVDILGTPSLTLLMTTCGGRSIQITGLKGAPAIDTMRASFHCTATGERPPSHSVAVQPRKGWRRKPLEDALALTNKDDVMVLLSAAGNDRTPAYAKAFTLDGSSERRGAYTIQRGRVGKDDHSVHPGAVVTWPCPERKVTGYAYISQWGRKGLDDGISLALTARCYRADEPLPAYD